MTCRGQLAVRFAHDPPDFQRLVLAQSGKHFMVGRVEGDPPGDVPGGRMLWFRWEDPKLAPELTGLYFSRDDLWADQLFPKPQPVEALMPANGREEEDWSG